MERKKGMAKKTGWLFQKSEMEKAYTNEELERNRETIEKKILEIQQLREQLRDAKQQQKSYQEDSQRLNKTIAELKEIQAKHVEELYQEKWENEQLKNTIKEERATSQEQIETLQKRLWQDSDRRKEIGDLTEQIKKLTHQLLVNQRQLEETKKQKAVIEKQLNHQITELKNDQRALKDKVQKDAEALEKQEASRKAAVEKLTVFQQDYTKLDSVLQRRPKN